MSPELVQIELGKGFGSFNPILSDIFSLGLTFIRVVLTLDEKKIIGLNSGKDCSSIFDCYINKIPHFGMRIIIE